MVKQTEIVNQHKIPRIWILIADAHTAKIFKRDGEKLEAIAGMQPTFPHSSDLKDKAEPYTRNDHRNEKEFSSEIALWLDNALRSNSYDRLVLVAAPRMLGHLRHAIGHNVQDRIVAQVDKDLTKMPENDLQAELTKIVWF
jgi:protein required for attachment to host cells